MEIEFDPAKDATNIAVHGMSLAIGRLVLEKKIGEVEDTRVDYGEARFKAFGIVEGRLFCCVYTHRGDVARVISVRVANRKERLAWLT